MKEVLVTCERCGRDVRLPFAAFRVIEWKLKGGRLDPHQRGNMVLCQPCARVIDEGGTPWKAREENAAVMNTELGG